MSSRVRGNGRRVRVVEWARRLARRGTGFARRRLGVMPRWERVHWFGTSSPRAAASALAIRAGGFVVDEESWVLTIGDGGPLHKRVDKALAARRITAQRSTIDAALQIGEGDADGLVCVVSAYTSAAAVTRAVRDLLAHPVLRGVPFEHVSGMEPERRQFRRHDEYDSTFFVSPVLLADPSPYAIYEESLRHFEQKCGLRDFLDLYQALVSIERRALPGAIAEFGSYRGHSGWLIARTLQALGSDRRLFMFDTFESFPDEEAGVDHFWSQTHVVSFTEVAAKLAPFSNVELVRGDFTTTLSVTDVGALALAYVDCDSYRAVKYVATAVFDELLVPGGVMLFEDYGHPALLGCRVAVHESLDRRDDCVQFLSQFSGVYLVLKPDCVDAGGGSSRRATNEEPTVEVSDARD